MDREQGRDKPVVVRFYGDSRRDAMARHGRVVSAGRLSGHLMKGHKPDIPDLPDQYADKKVFMTTVSDGSTTI